ncbi:hypothetical protein O181_088767 [Austropuccinia psidii MF-1]|uniref:Uncharacterized protein n=1 Tax=Austropuccinia psidii MF-1 TaxID=1389203 RepID=A0A9Q3P5P0_9BASI|nr:hypothetical protein [Austropuccinia psidii MF-1]
MEDARTSNISQRLASTFDTIIESPEADRTAIAVIRPESLSKGNNRDIPLSVQELLISSSEEDHGARNEGRTSEGLDTHVLQGKSPTDKSLVENPKHVIRGPEEEVGPREREQPSRSSPSLKKCQTIPRKPKRPTKRVSQEREDSHGQCVQYGKNCDGIQKQGREKIEPIFSKGVDLVDLLNQIETCNKEIITKLKTFEYIQQKLGNEILQVKDSQKTIIGLENVNKDNVLSLTQICARIEVGPRQGPNGSSPRLNKQKSASTRAQHAQANSKDQPEGQEKGKGKGKAQMDQSLPAKLQDSQEREDSHGRCVQYGKNFDGIQKQGRGNIESIFSKEVDLLKLVNQIETCNKEIVTNFKTFEYIQQKLGNEILQVKESQKTMIGLENINKDNILSLTQICARIESKVTLLNQPNDNSISFITTQLKELKLQVKNFENSTGHNAVLFQEQLEKSDKART